MARIPFPQDKGSAAVGLAGLAGAALGVVLAREDTPPGPAGRAADALIEGVRNIPDAQVVDDENIGGRYMIEFHMPDQDTKHPSAVVFDMDSGRLKEATIRMGPLGEQAKVGDEQWQSWEADWFDMAFDAAPASIQSELDGRSIDLGDKWVSDLVRPHVRLYERDDGYDIPPRDLVTFLESLSERWERKFGHYADRVHSREYGEYFADYK